MKKIIVSWLDEWMEKILLNLAKFLKEEQKPHGKQFEFPRNNSWGKLLESISGADSHEKWSLSENVEKLW